MRTWLLLTPEIKKGVSKETSPANSISNPNPSHLLSDGGSRGAPHQSPTPLGGRDPIPAPPGSLECVFNLMAQL